jgi:hypothetical protein
MVLFYANMLSYDILTCMYMYILWHTYTHEGLIHAYMIRMHIHAQRMEKTLAESILASAPLARGLGLVVHIPSGCVAKINIP